MDRSMPRLFLGALVLAVLPILTGATSEGCGGGDVTVGTDEPGDCWTGTGCAVTVCAEGPPQSVTCKLSQEKECIMWLGVCERDDEGECGWVQSPEMVACLADERMSVNDGCARSSFDECDSDADCTTGGCGGEVCHNPAVSDGASDCDCTAPTIYGCGCVRGNCTWFE
jgi:hypothetical protein